MNTLTAAASAASDASTVIFVTDDSVVTALMVLGVFFAFFYGLKSGKDFTK